jgi:heme exporter protein D
VFDPVHLARPAASLTSVEQLRMMLRDRLACASAALALLLVVDAAAACGVAYAAFHGFIVFSAFGFTALILLTARAVQRVRTTRAGLRQLARLAPALPRAVVHRRASARRAG